MSLHCWLARIWTDCEWAGTALYSLGITLTDGPTQPGLNLGNWILTRSYRLGLTLISVGLTQIDVNLPRITGVQQDFLALIRATVKELGLCLESAWNSTLLVWVSVSQFQDLLSGQVISSESKSHVWQIVQVSPRQFQWARVLLISKAGILIWRRSRLSIGVGPSKSMCVQGDKILQSTWIVNSNQVHMVPR